MSEVSLPIYEAVYAYVEESYKQQAADDHQKWTQEHNEFVEAEVAGLYGQIAQSIEMYMSHLASPLPVFEEEENNDD